MSKQKTREADAFAAADEAVADLEAEGVGLAAEAARRVDAVREAVETPEREALVKRALAALGKHSELVGKADAAVGEAVRAVYQGDIAADVRFGRVVLPRELPPADGIALLAWEAFARDVIRLAELDLEPSALAALTFGEMWRGILIQHPTVDAGTVKNAGGRPVTAGMSVVPAEAAATAVVRLFGFGAQRSDVHATPLRPAIQGALEKLLARGGK